MNLKVKFLFLTLLTAVLFSCNSSIKYYDLPAKTGENKYNAVIEIPSGTNKKIEFNKESNSFEIDKKNGKDRVVEYLPYLGNYGFIPSTYSIPQKGGDGDALDVLILSESVEVGAVLEFIPIAVLKLIDNGESDFKIIGIPTKENKQIIRVSSFNQLKNEYPEVLDVIELWFLKYNKNDPATSRGWGDEVAAINEIEKWKL